MEGTAVLLVGGAGRESYPYVRCYVGRANLGEIAACFSSCERAGAYWQLGEVLVVTTRERRERRKKRTEHAKRRCWGDGWISFLVIWL